MRRMPAAVRAAAFGAVALLLGGCGIRGTSVPVDAGPAPSRASCAAPKDGRAPQLAGRVPVKVYLVCASQLQAVQRSAQLGDAQAAAEPLLFARELLGQLQEEPSAAESEAGFGSDVLEGVEVFGPAGSDPKRTLRLNRLPEELSPFGLAQLVCTYAHSAATADKRDSVILGGPETAEPPKRYTCDARMREHPSIALSSGVPVG